MKDSNFEWLLAGGSLTAAVGALFKWVTNLGTIKASNRRTDAETIRSEVSSLQDIIHELRINYEVLKARCEEERIVLQAEINQLKVDIANLSYMAKPEERDDTVSGQL